MIATEISVLDVLYVVMLKISFWSGMKRISAEDLGGVNLPPADLASLGCKKLVDPNLLKVFGTIRCRATTYLDRNAVRFCGGWSFHEDYAFNVIAHLDQCRTDFENARDVFLSQYEDALEQWKCAHAEWAQILEHSAVSSEEVKKKFNFNYQIFRMSPPNDEEVSQGLVTEVENLGHALFSEIAADAKDVWKRVFEGRISCSQKALSPIRNIREKLYANSYIEPNLSAPLVRLIDQTLSYVNLTGSIEGVQLSALQGLVSMLADPDKMLEHARLVIEGKKSEEAMVNDFATSNGLYDINLYINVDSSENTVENIIAENADNINIEQANRYQQNQVDNVIASHGLW